MESALFGGESVIFDFESDLFELESVMFGLESVLIKVELVDITKPNLTNLFRPLDDYTDLPASEQGSSVDDPETY
jgi:hypothetical protein